TSDVWMAGRKARILTTAAGPISGLVLAGVAQIVGLLFPPLAPWAFKLSFAWYINVLFNLNPFLALDGYYLLMDWLEIPNLRARGVAWGTRRGRPRRRGGHPAGPAAGPPSSVNSTPKAGWSRSTACSPCCGR